MECNQVMRPPYNFTYTLPASSDNECAIQLPGIRSNTLWLIEVNSVPIKDLNKSRNCTGSIKLVKENATLYEAELCKNGVLQSFKIFYRSRLNSTLHLTSQALTSVILVQGKFIKIGLQLLRGH